MKEIRHDGIIDSIGSDGHVCVRITQTAACSGCKIASHCNASEQKVKTVDVYDCFDRRFSVGDSVVVTTSEKAAAKALLLGFGLPLLLLLAVLVSMMAFGQGEGASALAALAVLAPYYFVLWLCRNRIAGNIAFHIEK